MTTDTELTGTTHVLLVTDMSGSMRPLAEDVRGGFNAYLDGLRADGGDYRITAVLFDDQYDVLCADAALADAPSLDSGNYQPRGMTALLDAVGRTITALEARNPVLPDGDRVLLVVQTDGAENHSREYRWDTVAEMIREREKTGRWSCIYLGAHADAWAQASRMGFDRGSTIAVAHTGDGTQSSYTGLTHATRAYSKGATAAEASDIVRTVVGDDQP